MEKLVLLDVDGVLADFVGASLDLIREHFGRSHTPWDVTSWDFKSLHDFLTIERPFWELTKTAGFCSGIRPYTAALDGVRKLREIAKVEFLTSPMHGSPTWVHERDLWLEKHFDAHHHDIHHVRRKERVMGDVLVDDKTEHVIEWQKTNPEGVGILWQQPYNAGVVRSWDRVAEIVASLGCDDRSGVAADGDEAEITKVHGRRSVVPGTGAK